MALTTTDENYNALANDNDGFQLIDKSSIANLVAGQEYSLWRATGTPGQGVIPTAAAICTRTLQGALTPYTNQTAPRNAYLGWAALRSSNANMSIAFADRVVHNGNGELNITTLQTDVAVDVLTLALPAARVGASNYSNLRWYLEVYTDGGATASNATVNVTYDDASTGNLNVIAVGGTLRVGRLIALDPFIPTAQQGKHIRGINSVQLSANTTVAGAFGFTCMRWLSDMLLPTATAISVANWDLLGSPLVPVDACVVPIGSTSTTSSGTLIGRAKICYG